MAAGSNYTLTKIAPARKVTYRATWCEEFQVMGATFREIRSRCYVPGVRVNSGPERRQNILWRSPAPLKPGEPLAGSFRSIDGLAVSGLKVLLSGASRLPATPLDLRPYHLDCGRQTEEDRYGSRIPPGEEGHTDECQCGPKGDPGHFAAATASFTHAESAGIRDTGISLWSTSPPFSRAASFRNSTHLTFRASSAFFIVWRVGSQGMN